MRETPLATGWEFSRLGASDWKQARVPGCVHDDLVRHGMIADPFYRTNERECAWVDDSDWVYRCRFEWSPAPGCPNRVLLFEGLDTVCSVSLNGDLIAQSDNMFLPLEVDVTSLLRASNELRIEFSSAVRVANERRSRYLAQEGIAPSLTTFYERSFVRKAQYMFGWDWGPRLVSCGVWKPVSLIEYDSLVRDLWARPRLGDEGWVVDVSWEGERLGKPDVSVWRDQRAEVIELHESGARILLREPKLWCPSSVGQPHVYTLQTDFGGAQKSTRFGCRTVELSREPDAWGESFEFVVNGEHVFCKGANWIPDHSYPAVAALRTCETLAALQWTLRANMVRAWGGGLYESDAFYDRCDQVGTMVWQDFPFACAYYPEDEGFLASVEAEARANVRRLRNHPSLVLWCGNNENQQMHEQRWGGEQTPGRFYGEKIYDELLPRVLLAVDPDRPYVTGSPSGKVEGRDCNMDGVGDSHYWDVWHGRGDWKHYEESTSRFSSEFGFASSPSLYAWSKTLDRDQDWAPDSEAVKWHDKTLKGFEKSISYIELHYPKVATLEDLVYYSQLNQRDALRHGIEHYLRSDFCRGTLLWQFNDCWPVQSWSLMDFERRPKAAFGEVARLYSEVSSSIRVSVDAAEFWVTNHSQRPFDPSVIKAAGVYSTQGECVVALEPRANPVSPGESARLGRIEITGHEPAQHFAFVSLFGLDRNFRLFVEPKHFQAEATAVVAHLDRSPLVRFTSGAPVFDLWVYDPDDLGNVASPSSETIPIVMPGHSPVNFARFDHEPSRLVARSLAGPHRVEITRSPP